VKYDVIFDVIASRCDITGGQFHPVMRTKYLVSKNLGLEMTIGMGFPMRMGIPWDSHGNGNWLQNWEWEWEGMGIDCMGMGGSGNVKSHSRDLYLGPKQ